LGAKKSEEKIFKFVKRRSKVLRRGRRDKKRKDKALCGRDAPPGLKKTSSAKKPGKKKGNQKKTGKRRRGKKNLTGKKKSPPSVSLNSYVGGGGKGR